MMKYNDYLNRFKEIFMEYQKFKIVKSKSFKKYSKDLFSNGLCKI